MLCNLKAAQRHTSRSELQLQDPQCMEDYYIQHFRNLPYIR